MLRTPHTPIWTSPIAQRKEKPMSKTQNGYLIIADITGYTAFLSGSELEHAEDSLRALIDLLIEHTKVPLMISRLEGDAVISYADKRSILQGQTLVEMMEATYVAFKRAIELMVLNTTCTCNACRNIPNLDLKFFVHYGTYMLQELPSYTELIGTDVNTVHRLTKNTIREKTNIEAYVAYSQAAVDALGIQELADTMTAHTEVYEHIGAVNMFVQDMGAVWERRKEGSRILVQPEDAIITCEYEYPLAPMLMWDYVTKPEYKAILSRSDSANLDRKGNNRTGLDSSYICAHGKDITPQTIVDWQPFEQYTVSTPIMMGVSTFWTTRLEASENGTKITLLAGELQGGNRFARWFLKAMTKKIAIRNTIQGFEELGRKIEKEIEEGTVFQPNAAAVEFSPEAIRAAIAESLAS